MNTVTNGEAPPEPATGPQLTEIELGDPPEAWRAAGFDVGATGRFSLGSTVITCSGAGAAFHGWDFEPAVDGGSIDGLPTRSRPTEQPPVAASGEQPTGRHPNGIVSIDHVVIRTGNCERTIDAFVEAGFGVRGGRSTTSYGSPMRQTFFWAGDVIIELVGPDDGEPTTDEVTSVFGLALTSSDLASTGETLGELLGTPKDAVQAGRQIAGLRNKVAGIALPVAVMSPHVRSGT